MPTKSLGYDYTFNIGSAIYNRYDCNTVFDEEEEECKVNDNDDDDDDKDNENDDKDDDEPNHEIREKLSKILTSWIVINNDKEFTVEIAITPGL